MTGIGLFVVGGLVKLAEKFARRIKQVAYIGGAAFLAGSGIKRLNDSGFLNAEEVEQQLQQTEVNGERLSNDSINAITRYIESGTRN